MQARITVDADLIEEDYASMFRQKIQSVSKKVHLPCTLEVAGNTSFLKGYVLELSEIEATLHIPALAVPNTKTPQHGRSCLLKIWPHGHGGTGREVLRIPCHIFYIATVIVHVNLNTEELDEHQREIFDALFE